MRGLSLVQPARSGERVGLPKESGPGNENRGKPTGTVNDLTLKGIKPYLTHFIFCSTYSQQPLSNASGTLMSSRASLDFVTK